MNRLFTPLQRRVLFFISGGLCTKCKKSLDKHFHADHKVSFSNGGKTFTNNGQALCASCNLIKGKNND